MHMGSPNMKSLSRNATSEKGIHNTDSNRSLTAKFNKNKLVIVCIFLILVNVKITKVFPRTESKNMIEYNTIFDSALSNGSKFLPPDETFLELFSVEFSPVKEELIYSIIPDMF